MSFRADFEHHDDLLCAAIDEFADRGYERASVNRVLDRSGVSKGQLYHHFGSKEGLFLALVEWMVDRKAEWFAAHPVALPGDDFVAMLGAQIDAALAFAAAHPDVERLGRAVLAERGRPVFDAVVARFGFDPDSALGHLVDQASAQGSFRPELSAPFVRRAVLLLVNHLPELLDLRAPDDLAHGRDEILAFLRAALLRPAV